MNSPAKSDEFRDWVGSESSAFPAERGRYHLYISHACPFSARAVIVRRLKGLEDIVSMSAVDPVRGEQGWAFGEGEFADPLNGFHLLSELYRAAVPGFKGRVSVPVLWDRHTGRIVSNQSADIARMLGAAWDKVGGDASVDLHPEPLRAQIDELNEWISEQINNGVYDTGTANTQADYESAYHKVFAALDTLEARLRRTRYVHGDQPTQSDWRLFPTLVRFDPVYVPLFKCNRNRLAEMPNLWNYTRDLYRWPGIAATVRHAEIKRHYYTSFPALNPNRIVPLGGTPDFDAPHDREARFGRTSPRHSPDTQE
jgi:glutathionyl-hydroquinone reductase